MGGKASILLVSGFSIIFLVIGMNYVHLGGLSDEKYVSYDIKTNSHTIAVSGANMAAGEIYQNSGWRTGYNQALMGGWLRLSMTALSTERLYLQSVGIFQQDTSIVNILFQASTFSKFAYYVNQMPSTKYFTSGDTIYGPLHANGRLNVSYSPVFQGKVTTLSGLKMSPSNSTPKFNGGYQQGVNIPLPSTSADLRSAALAGGRYYYDRDVWLTFNADATVTYKIGSTGTWITETLASFAPNSIIYVDKGNLHIKGTVNGQYTVAASGSSGLGLGNVYLDDDLVYRTDPLMGSCSDLLGVVADNNVIIADQLANKTDINIMASLMCLNGGLMAEDYQHIPLCGAIRLTGGLIESMSQPVNRMSGTTMVGGYNQILKYDERLLKLAPPLFPKTGAFEILSWWE